MRFHVSNASRRSVASLTVVAITGLVISNSTTRVNAYTTTSRGSSTSGGEMPASWTWQQFWRAGVVRSAQFAAGGAVAGAVTGGFAAGVAACEGVPFTVAAAWAGAKTGGALGFVAGGAGCFVGGLAGYAAGQAYDAATNQLFGTPNLSGPGYHNGLVYVAGNAFQAAGRSVYNAATNVYNAATAAASIYSAVSSAISVYPFSSAIKNPQKLHQTVTHPVTAYKAATKGLPDFSDAVLDATN